MVVVVEAVAVGVAETVELVVAQYDSAVSNNKNNNNNKQLEQPFKYSELGQRMESVVHIKPLKSMFRSVKITFYSSQHAVLSMNSTLVQRILIKLTLFSLVLVQCVLRVNLW